MRQLAIALRVALVTLVATGIVYPLAVTAAAQLAFPHRANGSIVTANGREVGSALLGQTFAQPGYLHGRPSANGYDAANSGGTNLAVTSAKLRAQATQAAAAVRAENQLAADAELPVDAVTASASGLDPHISPAYARLQAPRIAKARGVAAERVQAILDERTESHLLGDATVNVLEVNLALDRSFGVRQ